MFAIEGANLIEAGVPVPFIGKDLTEENDCVNAIEFFPFQYSESSIVTPREPRNYISQFETKYEGMWSE